MLVIKFSLPPPPPSLSQISNMTLLLHQLNQTNWIILKYSVGFKILMTQSVFVQVLSMKNVSSTASCLWGDNLQGITVRSFWKLIFLKVYSLTTLNCGHNLVPVHIEVFWNFTCYVFPTLCKQQLCFLTTPRFLPVDVYKKTPTQYDLWMLLVYMSTERTFWDG